MITAANNKTYVLIKHRFTGFSVYDNYSVYEYNAEKEELSDLPVARIQSHRTTRKYAPYVFSSMMIVSWAIARCKISLTGDTKIDAVGLHSLFLGLLDELNTAHLDILTIAAP